jgi:hypothetical protein
VCGVVTCFWNIPIRRCAAATLVPGPKRALSRLLLYYYRDANIDRASQVLVQGVPLSILILYRILIDYYNNISYFIFYYYTYK